MKASRLLGPAAGVVVLLVQLLYWLPNHAGRDAGGLDVPGYYRAAAHVLAGEPLYREVLEGGWGAYIYPPTFAVAIAPLALLGPVGFQAVWYGGILVAFWLYAAALVRLAGRELRLEHVLTAGAILLVVPGTSTSMSFGNIDLLIWALCAASLEDGRAPWAAVAGAFKIYPGWSLLAGGRRELVAGAAAAAAVLGLTAAVAGPGAFVDWIKVAGMMSAGVDWHTNVSLSFRAAELLGHVRLTAAFSVIGSAAVVLLVRRGRRGRASFDDPRCRMEVFEQSDGGRFGWTTHVYACRCCSERKPALSAPLAGAVAIVGAMALGPICWVHYAPALLMPAAALLRRRP